MTTQQQFTYRMTVEQAKGTSFQVTSSIADETSVIKSFNYTASIDAFPTGKLHLHMNPSHPQLLNIDRGDAVRIEIQRNEEPFSSVFFGEIVSQTFNFTEKDGKQLVLDLISPFVKLGQENLNADDVAGKSFQQLCEALIEKCAIRGAFRFHPSVPSSILLGYVHRFPALALIKMICYQHKLALHIPVGDVLEIRTISAFFDDTPVFVLNESDIVSGELRRN